MNLFKILLDNLRTRFLFPSSSIVSVIKYFVDLLSCIKQAQSVRCSIEQYCDIASEYFIDGESALNVE